MKVCLYVGSHPPYTGGGQTFIDEICKALAKKLRPPSSWQPCLAGEDPGWGARAKDLGLRFVRVPKRLSGRRWMKILPAVDRAGRRAGFLHEHGFAGVLNLSPMEWIDLDTPYVQVVWDLQHRLQPWFPEVSYHGEWERRETAYRSVLPRASFVVTGTRAGKSELLRFYGLEPDLVRVIPLPTPGDVFDYPETPHIPEKNHSVPYLFYPAQFWRHKNHHLLLEAMHLLRQRDNGDLRLILTGSDRGQLAPFLQKARDLDLAPRVEYRGVVDREELIRLYRGAFALVFPSLFGPDNLPPLEAFALGCPVLAARVAGAEEQLGEAAELFDPYNPAELAEKILKIKNEPKTREKMIECGHQQARVSTADTYVERLMALMELMLIRTGGP